jgi:ABC-2 type transport system ATP-binding protein
MIEVNNLTKYYGSFPALRDVTFNVEQGEILGFLGPNGAGKTTTMRVITGYIPPTSGTVSVAGYDVTEKSLEARKHLGYLPETVPLYAELTPWEYLDFKGRISGMHNTRERRARMVEIMDRINLADVSGKLIGSLSRGYRQRVGLAQAMLHNPSVLILDEPTVGLDPVQITDARELIKELGRDHTIILSTHLLPEVSMVCNRVIIINRGRLVALDTPFHLTEGAGDGTIQLEIAGPKNAVLDALKSVSGVTKVETKDQDGSSPASDSRTPTSERQNVDMGLGGGPSFTYNVEASPGLDVRAELALAVVGAGYSLLELKTVRPSLEEIFIRVISQAQEDELADGEVGGLPDDGEPDEFDDEIEAVEEESVAPVVQTRTSVTTKRRVRR